VICAVTVEESVPRWMKDQKVTGGWITAEYSMLPYSTLDAETARHLARARLDGRSSGDPAAHRPLASAPRLTWKSSGARTAVRGLRRVAGRRRHAHGQPSPAPSSRCRWR
jgi:hypothetical protein